MATKKSKVVKKTKVIKKAAPKKAVKRVAPARTVKRVKKAAPAKSFALSAENKPFVAFKITDQTIYWSVLLAYILLLSLWILKIQIDTQSIIDKISISL